jgi:carbohydrate kinase (thermoresistant glucokinase family)
MNSDRLIVIVMGVSSSGKSTIGRQLAERLHWPFQEGDELHTPAAVKKMKSGQPLNDADRRPWLAAIARWIDHQRAAQAPGLITCSALKRRYRRPLLEGRPEACLLYLRTSEAVAQEHAADRKGHFMPAGLVHSQFEALEEPAADEQALVVDQGRQPIEETVAQALRLIQARLRTAG